MTLVSDIRKVPGLSDADVSNKFKNLVDGYIRDLNNPKNNKGNPGTSSKPSVRVGKIRRKRGQLIPSQILFAMRDSLWRMGWTQGTLQTAEGHMCLRGALVYLYGKGYFHNDDGQIAAQYLHDEVQRKNGDSQKYNFIYWNNDPKRTLSEILKVLEDSGNRARLAGE
jgi:hypothetical protein